MATIIEKIFHKLGTFDTSIFQRLHLFLVNNYFVYYDTLQNYQSRTDPLRERRLIYNLINLVLVSGFIKFVLLTYYEDDWLKVITGEVIFLFVTEYRRVYAYVNFGFVFVIILKLVIFYYEKNKIIDFNKLDSNSKLLKYHNHSFLIVVNSVYWLGYIVTQFITYIVTIFIIILALIAYFNDNFNFYLVVLIISTIQFFICVRISIATAISCIMLITTLIIFLKWKQDEIIKSIRFSVIWRNKVKLNDGLKVYHQFTRTISELSRLINMVIGMIYILTPIMLSQGIIIINGQANSKFDNLIQLIFVIIITFVIILIYIFNHLASSITLVNQSIPKFLYPVFNNMNSNNQVGLKTNNNSNRSNILFQMKIDSFIARLNEEYVGFYCFNLFQFTKLAYFQYLYMFMSAYVLIQDFK